jgi:hypothetical protein
MNSNLLNFCSQELAKSDTNEDSYAFGPATPSSVAATPAAAAPAPSIVSNTVGAWTINGKAVCVLSPQSGQSTWLACLTNSANLRLNISFTHEPMNRKRSITPNCHMQYHIKLHRIWPRVIADKPAWPSSKGCFPAILESSPFTPADL